MPNPIVHFEIMGSDGSALLEFYHSLFEWEIHTDGDVTGYSSGGHLGEQDGEGIGGSVGVADGTPYVTIYVDVADIQASWLRAMELGAEPVLPPTVLPEIQGLIIARFRDPDGNLIGLSQRPA